MLRCSKTSLVEKKHYRENGDSAKEMEIAQIGLRGRSKAAATSKMERFVTIVNGFQLQINFTAFLKVFLESYTYFTVFRRVQ